jgi:integrase
VLRYERHDRERMLGLGPLAVVSLKQARERAREARRLLLENIDPVAARKQAKADAALEAAKTKTFRECAEAFFKDNQSKWRSAAHAREYIGSLRRLAYPTIGGLAVGAIGTGEVMRVLKPQWERIPETATRLRQRIEAVLDWAAVFGYRAAGDNPARWSGHLEHLLPRRDDAAVKHFAALPYTEVAAFLAELRQRGEIAERALEFAILTATRSGEVMGARWSEVDLDAAVWTIPPERQKKKKRPEPHRVPLSTQALALLEALPRQPDNPFVFTRPDGRALGKDSLERALARIRDDVTVHGFRSAFRDWAAERTAFPHEVCERALAHVTGSKTSRAYQRADLLTERAKLMSMWADYCYSPPAAGEVVPLRKAARP